MVQGKISDSEYLMSAGLGQVIGKGLAEMYDQEPNNPVDFLSKWLLNYSQVEKAAENREEEKSQVQQAIQNFAQENATKAMERTQEQRKREQVQDNKDEFRMNIAQAHDLNDQLQELTDHLQQFTKASSVYIGKLVHPKKAIEEGDNDKAHIDKDSEQIIHFSHADADHKFMVDQVLAKGSGLTFDVFNDKVDDDGKPVESEELNHILVKEVVREPRMHFYKVPRLGSYLAIRLEYESCLSVEAYNEGVKDALSCRDRILEQENAKEEHEAKEKQRKEDEEHDGKEYTRDEGSWASIKTKPFQTKKSAFVVCLNTMGQDREFTAEEIAFALDTTKNYRDEWQRIEENNLRADIDRKLDNMEAEKLYKEVHEALDIAEAEKRAEEATTVEEGKEPLEEFAKSQAMKVFKWNYFTQMFWDPEGAEKHKTDKARSALNTSDARESNVTPNTSVAGADDTADQKHTPLTPEYWKQPFLDLKELNIMKLPRVLQTLFYLLGYTREEVCERDTNKLDFKKVKNLINDDLFKAMSQYHPVGSRESEFKEYQKLSFLQTNVDSMEESMVDEYSVILGRIHRWITQALDLRIDDIRNRRDTVAVLKYERDNALADDKARAEKREAALEEKQAEHEEKEQENAKKHLDDQQSQDEDGNAVAKLEYETQEFNLEEFNIEFDTLNPTIEIPNEVEDPIDNDFDLPYSPPDMQQE